MQVHPARPPPPDEPKSWQPRLSSLTKPLTPLPVEYVDEHVSLSTRVWLSVWCLVLALIVSNAIVLGVFSSVYAQCERVGSLCWFVGYLFAVAETTKFLHDEGMRLAVGYGVLSCIFGGLAIRMVALAIANVRLTRTSRSAATNTQSTQQKLARICSMRLLETFNRWWDAMGMRSASFDSFLLMEEWFELVTQTIAAYSASRSISNAPLNLTYAVIIFVNSVSTAILTRLFPASLMIRRLASVITDLVLDFLWGTLLPVWMYVPVVDLYMHQITIYQDPSSYSGFVRQVQRILVLKLLDLQSIVRELVPASPTSCRVPHLRVGFQRPGRLARLAHALLPVYGLGILLTSLAANEVFTSVPKQKAIPCGYRVHPWFSGDEACLRRQLNCTALGVAGDAQAFGPMLAQFDQPTLSEIHFVDCSALAMPSAIRTFPNLMSIVIVNSTIVKWDETVLLSGVFFHDLRNVQLYSVSFGDSDPVGFTGLDNQPLAPTLEWVHLQDLDGNRILPLVHNHWHHVPAFDCQNCSLTVFPELAFTFERLEIFSLAVNDIAEIPGDWTDRHDLHLKMLWLDVNPRLAELPDSLWHQSATCGVFSVTMTNLSSVPEWVADVAFPGFQAMAFATPLCASGFAGLSPRMRALTWCEPVYSLPSLSDSR